MIKILQSLVFVAILTTTIFSQNLWEQKCEDGTGYFQCSNTYPGYICVPSGSALTLTKAVGEVYDASHPTKAGQPTDNAIKCACENFAGYVEKDGECIDKNAQTTNTPTPVEQTQPQEQPKDEPTQPEQKENETDTTAQINQELVEKVAADKLAVPTQTQPQTTQQPQSFELGTMGIVGIVIAISVIGGIVIIAAVIIAAVVAFKLKK